MDFADFVLLACTAIDLAAGVFVLAMLARRPARTPNGARLTLDRVLAAAVIVGVVFAIKLPVAGALGLRLFGLIHLVWLDLVVVVPVWGALVLMWGRLRRRRGADPLANRSVVSLAVLVLLIPPVAVYAALIEPHRLVVERVDVPMQRMPSGKILTVAVLADLQFAKVTAHERAAIEAAMALDPDLIVLPGDIFQGSEAQFSRELAKIRALLSELYAPGGVYLVAGNIDRLDQLEREITGTGIVFLNNEVIVREVDGVRVAIGGITDDFASSAAQACIVRLSQTPADCSLLLSHRPDAVLSFERNVQPIDLTIAGHTHGGQVQIPGFGPLITLSRVPRLVAGGGLHTLNGHRLYVSRGVGCERGYAPTLRLFCPPEITLLTLGSP